MNKLSKRVQGLGGILFALGLVAVMVGGFTLVRVCLHPTCDATHYTTLMFEGNVEGYGSTTFEGDFKRFVTYNIFVSNGGDVAVEVLNSDADDIFTPCELDDKCVDSNLQLGGYRYIGDLVFEEEGPGTYEINFIEENGDNLNVMIREDTSYVSFLVLNGGVISSFAGIIILIIGIIRTKVMKENPKVELTSTVSEESGFQTYRIN